MCSAGQEVTHQDPRSRARAGPSTQRKKHETGVLEQEEEGKKKNQMQQQVLEWVEKQELQIQSQRDGSIQHHLEQL